MSDSPRLYTQGVLRSLREDIFGWKPKLPFKLPFGKKPVPGAKQDPRLGKDSPPPGAVKNDTKAMGTQAKTISSPEQPPEGAMSYATDKQLQTTFHAAKPIEKWTSAGGVVMAGLTPDQVDYIYIIKPSNNYGPWSFPKGRVDAGEGLATTAMREVEEETGLKVGIVPNAYLGKGTGRYSITHYFLMVRTGGDISPDYEVETVELVHWTKAFSLFRQAGNDRDWQILAKALPKIAALKEKLSQAV